jgi:molybdopterin molybdotransferase
MQIKTPISYQQAIEIIQQVATKHAIKHHEPCLLADTVERVLANDIYSPISVPSFNNSAMDGFAVKSDVVNQSIDKNGTIKLEVEGSIQAGDPSATTVQSNHLAWEIMTGAPVPDHFDAVIQIENVTITDKDGKKFIEISEQVKKDRNIRMLGTDYQIDQLVANKQTTLQAQHIMALATVGVVSVDVIPKIKVAILSTGNELFKVASGTLKSGTIFNSNQPFLKAFSKQLNCDPVFTGSCKDNIEAFNQLIDDALLKKVKIIFSTGAVSMGKYDFIPQALVQRGAKIHFHKSKIRPGKPILFAELPDGTIYFGLPGNPIAAASGMRFFVAPFITQMLGLKPETKFTAKLTNDIKAKHGFRTFAKAYASIDNKGQLQVEMLRDQGSYQSRSFAHSNCWLIIPENKGQTAAGELIEIASMVPNQIIF